MKKLILILAVIGAVLVIGVLAVLFLGGRSASGYLNTSGTAVGTLAQSFCDKLGKSDYSGAYALTDKIFQQKYTISVFQQTFSPLSGCDTIKLVEPLDATVQYGSEYNTVEYAGTLTAGSQSIKVSISAVDRSGQFALNGLVSTK